jgi:eukaryotic-like serine/threonine-protein kinase
MLAVGTKLGPYLIEAPAGAGGMGEVYKAKDTRLERTVAIKVLPIQIANNEDLRQRFDREAKAISSLNHPNICTLHDVGHQDGIDFLVMEYLDGETLAARLTKGPVPAADLLVIATQIADALDKAHRQGLVHRDLKPGNIMLTKGGAKLMDFGLAKLQQAGGIVQGVSGITRTTPLTGEGTIIGTLQYMSPEQLEGKEADVRSDIFSFGAILYEMATGKRAFEGGSQASLIAAILKENPRPIAELQPLSPPMLDRVIKQCLEKDPDHRWHAAGDLKRALQWIAEGGSQVGIPIAVSSRRKLRERLLWAAVALLAGIAGTLGYSYLMHTTPAAKVARFSILPPQGIPSMTWPKISPDGTMVAFIGVDTAGQTGIYVRPLNSLDAHLLLKTQSDNSRPFWSPDSKQLAFFESNQLKKVSIAGGLAQLICEAKNGSDGSWGNSGIIVFDGNTSDSVRQVPASGGVPTAASKIDHAARETMNAWPCFLPDGEHFLYLAFVDSSAEDRVLKVGSVRTLESATLTKVNSLAQYANGHIIYLRNNLLVAHPFDAKSLKLTGEPVPLSSQVSAISERGLFSASEDGLLVYQRGQSVGMREMVWVGRHGDSIARLGGPARYLDFSVSPDGSRVAYGLSSDQADEVDVWVRDLKRDVASRLTFGPAANVWPVWSADGAKVIFTSNRTGGRFAVYQRNANGTGTDELVYKLDSLDASVVDVSRDGGSMILAVSKNAEDLWMYTTRAGKAEPLLAQPYNEQRGTFSPDGRFMAYQSDESGRPEIYIRELSPTGGKWQVSTARGRCPRWRADGKELFYFTPEFDFMAVPISSDRGLEIGTPVKMFNRRVLMTGAQTLFPYAPSIDGQRFLLVTPTDAGSSSEFIVVQNWAEELKK